jgi:L-lactate dehydrogenase complex protein LldE
MNAGLFIPVYIDKFILVAIATYQLPRKLGCEVEYPMHQTAGANGGK